MRQQLLKDLDITKNTDETFYPLFSDLVINAIVACFKDPNPLVKRSILDFLIQHLNLSHSIYSESDKPIIVQQALSLMIKKD